MGTVIPRGKHVITETQPIFLDELVDAVCSLWMLHPKVCHICASCSKRVCC